ncbi:cell division protein PerM [Actinomyces radicidentis]|uniref:cell division protein PerM n=1 Tax=Actinomyces radicidentis TaxID=111015 RepID=UPI0026DFE1B2|nr:DUF6350 family protein [Actinomyces radicidentis]
MSRERGQRGLSEDQPTGERGTTRALPVDWPFAVRAGVESVLAGWLVVVVPTLAVFVSTSSLDAAAALSLGSALRTGTGLWGLALGGSVGSAESADGVLALPLLGVALLQAWLTAQSVRRARLTGPASGVWVVGSALLTSLVLVLLAGPTGTGSLPAVVGSALLALLVTAWSLHREGRGWTRASQAWGRRPRWVDPALALARTTAIIIGALVLLAALAAVVGGFHRFTRLYGAVSTGGVLGWLGLLLLQLAWVPTTLVWALAWLVGPGFVVGTGTVFAPSHVVAGSVPSLPLLGLLPTDSLSHGGEVLPLALSLAGLVAVWRHRRRLAALALPEALVAAVAAALVLALLTLIGCLLASGAIGPGRMADVGPRSGLVAGLLLFEVGVAVLAGTAVVHPWTRRAAEHGVEHTGAAATSARERVGAGLDAARERRAQTRRDREEARAQQRPVDDDPLDAASPDGEWDDDTEWDEEPAWDEGAEAPEVAEDDQPDDGRDDAGEEADADEAPEPWDDPDDADDSDGLAAARREPGPGTAHAGAPGGAGTERPRFTGWRARLADRLDRDEAEAAAARAEKAARATTTNTEDTDD